MLLFVTMSADAGLWLQLDGRELVSNGVVQELKLDCFRKKVIPLRWRVEKAGQTYAINTLGSENTACLKYIQVPMNPTGRIRKTWRDYTMTFVRDENCTDDVEFRFSVDIFTRKKARIQGSPFNLTLCSSVDVPTNDSCSLDCDNGGTCLKNAGVETCMCVNGWDGPTCRDATCSPECRNGGECKSPNNCTCPSLFRGPQCEEPICNPPCKNGGECQSPNQCRCPSNFRGLQCEEPICNPSCKNGGECQSPNRCQCTSEFRGPQCEEPICSPPCKNGGKCVVMDSHQCECQKGYTGQTCDIRTLDFLVEPVHTGIPMDSTAMLHCVAIGTPQPTVTWTFHGQEVGGPNSHAQVLANGTLVIQNFRMNDVGMYTCRAQNDYGTEERDAVLYPYVAIDFQRFSGSGSGSGSVSGHFSDDEDGRYALYDY